MKFKLTTLAFFILGLGCASHAAIRQDWETFKKSASYPVFVETIRKMRANTDARDKNSWLYWANVHQNYCPHSREYFLTWHRGYIRLFEERLRMISGDSSLTLPYWDYYKHPDLPAEFTRPGANNPLYTNRVNTNVASALSYTPFGGDLVNFPRSLPQSFEPAVESRPHNQVHNLIGGFMPTLQSPQDPIFWVHHANIDRLWKAWSVAGGGRKMPDATDSYWSGTFTYGTDMALPKIATLNIQESYADETLPRPPVRSRVSHPKLLQLNSSKPKLMSKNVESLGGATNLALARTSVAVNLSLPSESQNKLKAFNFQATNGAGHEVAVVLDGMQLTEHGKPGGYYFDVYLNLPKESEIEVGDPRYFIGTFGAFELNSIEHAHEEDGHGAAHGASAEAKPKALRFPIGKLLERRAEIKEGQVTVSIVYVGPASPEPKPTITVAEIRLEKTASQVTE